MKVAVLGCGPAGLMAAHAAHIAGADRVRIFSKRRKSQLFGCQYLHAPIPGMTDVPPVDVEYELLGSTEDYRAKVYGSTWQGEVSPEDYLGQHTAWDIRRTYDNLWARYADYVYGTNISAGWMGNFMDVEGASYDLIISTVPRVVTCRKLQHAHIFRYKPIWAIGDAPESGLFAEDHVKNVLSNNQVICSGLPDDPWYRASRVFGYSTVEFPAATPPALREGAGLVKKPLDHNCDCWPGVMFVGRFGAWKKDVLSHTAFQEVQDRLVLESVS